MQKTYVQLALLKTTALSLVEKLDPDNEFVIQSIHDATRLSVDMGATSSDKTVIITQYEGGRKEFFELSSV